MAAKQQTSSQWPPADLSGLPPEVLDMVFIHLSETDLCHVAMVCHTWRNAANKDLLWRPLCQRKGWERYGTSDDITKETPYVPISSSTDQQVAADSASTHLGANTSSNRCAQDKLNDEINDNLKEDSPNKDSSKPFRLLDPTVYRDVSFKKDCIIRPTDDSATNLVGTCRWKEIFMKACHLENNWDKQHYNVVVYNHFDLCFGKRNFCFDDDEPCVKVDKDYLVAYSRNSVLRPNLKFWNIRTGTCHQIILNSEHITQTDDLDHKESFQVKNGIVVIGCKKGVVLTFDASTGEKLHTLNGHKATEIVDIFFDGETIISRAEFDNDITVWNVTDGTCRHILRSPSEDTILYDKGLDYQDNIVAASYSDRCVRLWDTRSGGCIHTLQMPHFSPSPYMHNDFTGFCKLGDNIVMCFNEHVERICIWRKDSGEFVADIPDITSSELVFCNWGLIITHHDRFTGVYDELGRHLQEWRDFPNGKGGVFFFNKGRCVFEKWGKEIDIYLLKMTTKGLEIMSRVYHNEYIHVMWMDNTKMILHEMFAGGINRYHICHFW